ncbi:MAG: ABC transporter permease [Dehalococcoidia bacterium]
MATQHEATMPLSGVTARSDSPGFGKVVRSFARRKPLGAFGAVVIILIILAAIFAPVISPHDPIEQNIRNRLKGPSSQNLLGTDEFGRDVLSRIIWGARISLRVGIISVVIGYGTAMVLGLVSGYFGGRVDLVVQRVMDVIMAFPALVLALAVISAMGRSLTNVMLAIALVTIPGATRVIRSVTLAIKESQYVEASRTIGCSNARIILRHILPNTLAPFIIIATAGLGGAIRTEASLSFLGAGTQPPTASWGLMLSGAAQRFLQVAPHLSLYPGRDHAHRCSASTSSVTPCATCSTRACAIGRRDLHQARTTKEGLALPRVTDLTARRPAYPRGSPRPRVAITFRMISLLPPMMVSLTVRRYSCSTKPWSGTRTTRGRADRRGP